MHNRLSSRLLHVYRACTAPLRMARELAQRMTDSCPVSILYYHRIAQVHPTPWTIDRQSFEAHIAWLREHFDLVDLPEAQRRITEGCRRPTVHLTFDDGYEENDQWAIPWLLHHEIPVTYYVSTSFVSTDHSFPHDQALGLHLPANRLETLKRWQGGSVKFGAHTRTHCDLGKCTRIEQLIDEIVTSAAELGAVLNEPLVDFAFPFGQPANLHPMAFEICRQAGFRSVSSAYGERNYRGGDAFHLRRFHADPLLVRMQNWLTGDPREFLRPRYRVPEFSVPADTVVPNLLAETERLRVSLSDKPSSPVARASA